jgi:hypothetical protein
MAPGGLGGGRRRKRREGVIEEQFRKAFGAGPGSVPRWAAPEVWGPGSEHRSDNLRVYMGHLRHKLEQEPASPRYLRTEIGVGYRLAAE